MTRRTTPSAADERMRLYADTMTALLNTRREFGDAFQRGDLDDETLAGMHTRVIRLARYWQERRREDGAE